MPLENAVKEFKYHSVPYNPRFPNQNQTKHCWTAYVEWQKCIRVQPNKEQDPVCRKLQNTYVPLCPKDWVRNVWTKHTKNRFSFFFATIVCLFSDWFSPQISKWDEQVEQGIFPGQHVWGGGPESQEHHWVYCDLNKEKRLTK